MKIPTGGHTINSSAGCLFGVIDDPEIKKTEESVIKLQGKHQEIGRDLELPKDQLVLRYQLLYKNMRAEKAKSHLKAATLLGVGAELGAAAVLCLSGLGIAASTGLGICSLPLSFYAVPQLYAQVVSRLSIPNQVDKAMRAALEKEAEHVASQLQKEQERLNTLMTPHLQKESVEENDKKIEIDDEKDYVEIDGIRLHKKPDESSPGQPLKLIVNSW
ncbi:MAG: hypothetical protein AB2L14_04795 [Candidatus Xenobiia bacterium LiM19]